jgi:hypothetical protein
MHIDVLDEHHLTAAECAPTLSNPIPGDIPIYEKMQMRDAALVKFQNSDVFDGLPAHPSQIEPKFVEDTSEIPN